LSVKNRQELLDEIKNWITQSGFQLNSMPQSNHDFVITFQETKNLPELQLIHQKAENAYLLIVGLVKIPENDRATLKAQGEIEFSNFIWDMKLNLLRMGADFIVLGPDDKDPEAWEIQKRLFINQANATTFYDTCAKVKQALISVIWTYKRALGP